MVRQVTSQGKAHFIEPILLLRTENLPEGESWRYEIKLDGFRVSLKLTAGVPWMP